MQQVNKLLFTSIISTLRWKSKKGCDNNNNNNIRIIKNNDIKIIIITNNCPKFVLCTTTASFLKIYNLINYFPKN